MLNELENLIKFIQIEYTDLSDKWEESNYYAKINWKNTLVYELLENEKTLNIIFNYREFINENNIKLVMDFKQFNTDIAKVNIRAKLRNSIEFKIKNYILNHENGEIPINKCLNDLFGIRIICKKEISNAQINELIRNKFPNLKCIDSSKKDYKATHIYFKKDNFSFPWELQIWNEINEKNNIYSHEKYKQDYVRWEKESKGGAR